MSASDFEAVRVALNRLYELDPDGVHDAETSAALDALSRIEAETMPYLWSDDVHEQTQAYDRSPALARFAQRPSDAHLAQLILIDARERRN
jgi:hypothetical protein